MKNVYCTSVIIIEGSRKARMLVELKDYYYYSSYKPKIIYAGRCLWNENIIIIQLLF